MPVSKSDVPGQKPTQVFHINLDQPPISQSGGSGVSGVTSVQSQKPQITMEKISDRYHVEVKHDGPPTHGVPPPHQLPEGVVYTPLIPNLALHSSVMQISSGPQQVYVTSFVFFHIIDNFNVNYIFFFPRTQNRVQVLHQVMLLAAARLLTINNKWRVNKLQLCQDNQDNSLNNHCTIHVACFSRT